MIDYGDESQELDWNISSMERETKWIKERYNMFKPMAEILEEREGNRFKLKKFTVSEEEVKNVRMRAIFNRGYEYSEFIPDTYIKLIDKTLGEIVMSDTPMEKNTNMDLYENAKGNVLIGGLGIGMILLAIQDKTKVKSITVIEKYQEVIDLVGTQLPLNDKVRIINADVFKWEIDGKYDTIYMDIWNVIDGDYWAEHKKLNRKYIKAVNKENPNAWKYSWRKSDFQRLASEY